MDRLSLLGAKDIHVIQHHLPEKIRECLGSGKRWGLNITYHTATLPDHPFSVLQAVSRQWDKEETILIGSGDMIPSLNQEEWKQFQEKSPTFIDQDSGQWTGWASIQKKDLEMLHPKAPFLELATGMTRSFQSLNASKTYSARNYQELHTANMAFLKSNGQEFTLPSAAREVEPGVWISRNVMIHPRAHIKKPVFIGTNCQVLAGAVIGPDTILEDDCVIDERSHVTDSIVVESSYIGENLELRRTVADQSILYHIDYKTQIPVSDQFIISRLSPPHIPTILFKFFEKTVALALLLLLSPLLLYLFATHKLEKQYKVMLPASNKNPRKWIFFPYYYFTKGLESHPEQSNTFIPNLWNLLLGRMHIIGVSPRSKEELLELPEDWRHLILQSKVGLFDYAKIQNAEDEDHTFTAEIYYSAKQKPLFDLKVIRDIILNRIKNNK